MNPDSENPMPARLPGQRPPVEYLAAFLDGELSADDWARVQDWLDNHPEDAALVEAHRNLLRCWRETAPEEPSEKVWRELLAQIEGRGMKIEDQGSTIDRNVRASVDAPTSIRRRQGIGVGLLGAAAAAAVFLVLGAPWRETSDRVDFHGPHGIDHGIDDVLGQAEFPILTADDVDLVSMEGNDTRLLVVGNPPVHEPLVLVATGDVALDSIEPDDDGFVPQVRMNPGSSAAPMIIAPLRGSETKDSSSK